LATDGVLLDARTTERFRGVSEPMDPVAGHIPGARNLPAGVLGGPGGRLHEPATLRSIFERVGAGSATEIGAYCGSGVTAAQVVLGLEQAGLRGALYIGSWSNWIADAKRPVSTEAHPA
jgi:thiosulfate/3-mercaptopyruvate sulfurtransferase